MVAVPAAANMWYHLVLHVRVAYSFLSLGYGEVIHPPNLLGVSKPPYHRCRVAHRCGSAFLLDMWLKVNLADPSENSGQRFGSILPGGCYITLPGGSAHPMDRSLRVSVSWTSRP